MRILTEFPSETLKHLFHRFIGKREVRRLIKEYDRYSKTQLSPREYAVSFHNHSADGKVQTIEEIAYEAAEKGCKILAITDHNTDEYFNEQMGNKRLGHYNFDGKIIYVIRGIECNCMIEDKIKDLIIIGHKNSIKSGMYLDSLVKLAKDEGALIGITSPLNTPFFGLDKNQIEILLNSGNIDYLETFNSSKGAPFFHNDVLAAILLNRHNEYLSPEKKVGGIYVADSHLKKHVMDAFFGVGKKEFSYLENPLEVEKNSQRLIESLRGAIRNGRITNYGSYKKAINYLLDGECLESFLNQSKETLGDYARFRWGKHRARKKVF